MTSADFAVKVLEEEGVLVFPGTQYGACGEGFLRISYLAEILDIERAVEKLGRVTRLRCGIGATNDGCRRLYPEQP